MSFLEFFSRRTASQTFALRERGRRKKRENFSRNLDDFDKKFNYFMWPLAALRRIPNGFWWNFAADGKKKKVSAFPSSKRGKNTVKSSKVVSNIFKNADLLVCVVAKYRFFRATFRRVNKN